MLMMRRRSDPVPVMQPPAPQVHPTAPGAARCCVEVQRVVSGVAEFLHPPLLVLQISRLLPWPLVCPGDALQLRGHDRAESFAGVLCFPFGFEPDEVASDLRRPLRHHPIEWLQLNYLAGDGIEGQAMLCEGLREVWVRGDDRGSEGADRALLLEQRRRIQCPPLPSRKHPSADLHVNMPVRITSPRGLVADADDLHLLDRQHFPRVTRPDPDDGVLAEPAANLSKCILLRLVEGARYFGVEGGGDRQALGCVNRHLREQRRTLRPLTRIGSVAKIGGSQR